MKKFTFFIFVLLVTTFTNAQISLEHSFSGSISAPMIDQDIFGDFYAIKDKNTNSVNVYSADDYSLIWTLPEQTGMKVSAWLFSSNIFTTDGKFACIVKFSDESKDDNTKSHYYVYDEDNTIVADLGTAWDNEYVRFIKLSTCYKLLIEKVSSDYSFTTEIYSLPGNGDAQDIVSPSSLKCSTRKVIRDNQVLVETEKNTYTIQGQEVQ